MRLGAQYSRTHILKRKEEVPTLSFQEVPPTAARPSHRCLLLHQCSPFRNLKSPMEILAVPQHGWMTVLLYCYFLEENLMKPVTKSPRPHVLSVRLFPVEDQATP